MAPILLDMRGLFKAGISFALLLLIVFVGGFISGYQKALHQQRIETVKQVLNLPENITATEIALGPQLPEKVAPGADIDVDKPDSESDINPDYNLEYRVEPPAVSKIHADVAELAGSETLIAESDADQNKKKSPTVILKQVPNQKSETIVHTVKPFKTMAEEVSAIHKTVYAIQVGVYGRKFNAEKRISLLEEQGLKAYLSEYANNKKQRRYNVRFGYFGDRKTALTALKQYRSRQNANGYLVKLKLALHAENNLATTN